MKNYGKINCKMCGIECFKNGPVQSYCESCSEKKDLERKREWIKNNPLSKEKLREKTSKHISLTNEKGKQINKDLGQSIGWYTGEPNLLWRLVIKTPFGYHLSKNHIYATNHFGHRFLRSESRSAQDAIILLLKQSLRDKKVVQNKVWIDILVQKPNNRGDAINVIDLVCDGIKVAMGVDDRWFCIRRLDWEIVKENPSIYIGIGQDSDVNVQCCSSCGRLLEYSEFRLNKSTKTGVDRNCKECLSRKTYKVK